MKDYWVTTNKHAQTDKHLGHHTPPATLGGIPKLDQLIMHFWAVGGDEVGLGVRGGPIKQAIHICQENQQICLELDG